MSGWFVNNGPRESQYGTDRKRFSNDTLIAALRRPSEPEWSASSIAGQH